jgi:hypothetical protein
VITLRKPASYVKKHGTSDGSKLLSLLQKKSNLGMQIEKHKKVMRKRNNPPNL